ncbi:hypothetical protein ACH42_09765 [Endozoicomonas sp. (ex Bugula neritina AB1)]|nr:hypothetical protein ACH42_09765 [Endozoicomonas sp. (ex Bugula neritina AB1)]
MIIKTGGDTSSNTTLVSLSSESSLWLETLRQQVEKHGQKAVGKTIGYSTAVVSQVLSGKYTGDWGAVEMKVRGAYLGDTVRCPVLDELAVNLCLEYQRQPYAPTNRQRVRLFSACRSCPNRKEKEVV